MSDLQALSGQHAVVTGGSRGIGAAVAVSLAALGARVTIVARDRNVALEAARRMRGHVEAVAADLAVRGAVRAALSRASERSGPVSILVNNVGGADTAPFLRTDDDMWQRMFDLNFQPTRRCIRQVLPGMLDSGAGRIVNVASTAGLRGYAYLSGYVAAKHAVIGLTRALAMELDGRNVTVNAVCPGFVDTDMTRNAAIAVAQRTGRSQEEVLATYARMNPHGRLVRPSEVADKVIWFCLPEQSAENGQIIPIDGGEWDGKPQ